MSPEEHKAEAERLLAIARKPIMSGAPIGFDTHQDVVALAQVHATLALYRPEPINHLQVEMDRYAARRAGRRPQSENPSTDPSVTEKE